APRRSPGGRSRPGRSRVRSRREGYPQPPWPTGDPNPPRRFTRSSRGRRPGTGRRVRARPYNGSAVTKSAAVLPRPRLLFSTAPWFRLPLREAFRHIAGAGYEGVEVMVTQDPHTKEPHLLAGLAQEFGLSVEAIHAP